MMVELPSVRSALFIPGNRRDWMDKAGRYGADALVLDLEDAVPKAEKGRARDIVAEYLRDTTGDGPRLVRVNGMDEPEFHADVSAMVVAGATALVIPKVNTPDDVTAVERLVTWIEREHDLEPGGVALSPSFETASAIRLAFEVASASPRIAYTGGVAPRGGDVERSVGFRWSRSGSESHMFRAFTLLSLRAAGIHNPLSGLWTDIDDLDGLRAFAAESRGLGFDGLFVIHPSHVEIVNEAFQTTAAEREEAEAIIAAMEAAEREGRAAVILNGAMVDIAMVSRARQLLARP